MVVVVVVVQIIMVRSKANFFFLRFNYEYLQVVLCLSVSVSVFRVWGRHSQGASHPGSDGPPPSSEGHKSTIFGDKLMKFARCLVLVVLMKGWWKKLASDEYFICSCSPKMREKR